MIKNALEKVVEGTNLGELEMIEAMTEIMEGRVDPLILASFLTALRMKGETIAEITGAARVMRQKVDIISTSTNSLVDTCGTGGDGTETFNISTMSAFVAAGAGIKIAKHGNRAVSSRSGSADVIKALGVNIQANKNIMERCLNEVGISFLFAPTLHPAMKFAGPVRKSLGLRTIFNILGPLVNPAGANRQVIGVFDSKWIVPLARVLGGLGSERAYVVHGNDGLDEITLTGSTQIAELNNKVINEFRIEPEEFGFEKRSPEDLKGGTPEENAKIAMTVFSGEPGPARDITLLNAGAAISLGFDISIGEGLEKARDAIDSGAVMNKLNELIRVSNGD
tara:strand:- start:226 stop:1236 length:1011 start_codon:yes stop_codon:yes gene_type:complete